MPNGLASSATLASPRAKRDRMARRVGSASAERRTVRLSSIANLLYNKSAMVKRLYRLPPRLKPWLTPVDHVRALLVLKTRTLGGARAPTFARGGTFTDNFKFI